MNVRTWIAPVLLLATVAITGGGLGAWKYASIQEAGAASAAEPEPMETVTAAVAGLRRHRPTTTAIGTVLALQSVTLRNELPGTVREVGLNAGEIVEAGDVLVALDVSVEQAELRALEAQAALAQSLFERARRLNDSNAVSDEELERARAERDVAEAQVARTKAIIERKIVRAPFRARVGLADVHPGQYLNEGTILTTLQGVADAAHVDFEVAQHVAATLQEGDSIDVFTVAASAPLAGEIVGVDSRVDPATRNAAVRARIEVAAGIPAPGASVKVRVPTGPMRQVVAVPVSALRKGPEGDHVFVLRQDLDGMTHAHLRPVQSGAMLGDEVVIHDGLSSGELVAARGSFKLQDSARVALANDSVIDPAKSVSAGDEAVADVFGGAVEAVSIEF